MATPDGHSESGAHPTVPVRRAIEEAVKVAAKVGLTEAELRQQFDLVLHWMREEAEGGF